MPASSRRSGACRGTRPEDDAARGTSVIGLGPLETGAEAGTGLRSGGGSLAPRAAPGGMGKAGGAWPWPRPGNAGGGRGGGPPAALGLLALG